MAFPPVIAIASRNRHKIDEILRICSDWPVRWMTEGRDWPDVEETATTYLENALLKARAVAAVSGIPALADDSGIEIDAMHGAPGPRSARFAGDGATDEQNLELLIDRLRGVPDGERTGRYRCLAAVAWPDGSAVSAEGICEGRMILQPRGSGGFGYDPAFVPLDEDPAPAARSRTMAELSAGEKDAISHRGRALRQLRRSLASPNP
jgi:XTP/dITP diphosphohydrolase